MIRKIKERKNDRTIEPDIFVDKAHWFRVWVRCDFDTQQLMLNEASERGYEF